jgi:hypothetical protein
MKKSVRWISSAMAGLTVGVIGLAIALSVTASGCGDAGASATGAADGGSTVTTALPETPPIDLLAPVSFETASFAFG